MKQKEIKNQQRILTGFPEDFYYGCATSSYQVEGGVSEEGRGESIWDLFCSKEGNIIDGSSGAIACDHYHRWKEDIRWMKSLHLNAYRFSIAWPRIFPKKGSGINLKGLAFYDRLIDALLENNIEPFPTLYHWDLPQYLQEEGGWANRQTTYHFADYAGQVYDKFKDRVTHWTTLNEPYVSAVMGYYTGAHAPGIKSLPQTLAAIHHLLLAHGLASRTMRNFNVKKLKVGIALNLSPAIPLTREDHKAAVWYDLVHNRLFLDPLHQKGYPAEFVEKMKSTDFCKQILPGDLELIGQCLDFLGINYYTSGVVSKDDADPLFGCKLSQPSLNPYSDMWDFYPEGLFQLLERIAGEYSPKAIMILENGTSLPGLKDEKRIEFLEEHLKQIAKSIKKGIPVKGYFAWSLLDNFEWALGYTKRFGLIHVDFKTLKRTPKMSAHWYGNLRLNR